MSETDLCSFCNHEFPVDDLISLVELDWMICKSCKKKAERFSPESNIDYEKEDEL